LARFGTGTHKITHLGITPDGRRAISAGDDATLRVWNLNSREGTGLYADPDPFEDVDDDDEDGRTIRVGGGSARQPIAVGKPDATPLRLDVRLVGAHGPLAQQPAIAPVRKVTQITPRDDDDDPRRIRQKVSAVDFESPRFLDQGRLETAAVSRDGHLLACFGLDRMLTLWDLRNASKGASLQLAAAPREGESLRLHVQSPVLDRSGTRAAALTRDGLCFWRFDTAVAVRRSVKGVMAPLYLTADDSAVAAFCDDGCLRIWRLQDGRQVSRFEVARNASTAFVGVFACWLSPDGHFARVDLGRRKMLRTLTGFGSAAVVWPDGNFALTRPPSGGLAIWHLHREMVLATLPVAGAAGCAVALEPHGGLAAVAGDDLTLWEIPSGRRLDAITGDARFASCAFDADGVVLTANLQSGREHSFRVERQSTLPEF
jgi:WD40 repeat protein